LNDLNIRSLQVDTKAQIRQYLAEVLLFSDSGYEYDDNASFLEQGILDSMGVMELVYFVEETFGVKVADQDLTPENFDSVERLADYVSRNRLSSGA
jgi:acyl carrier protein